MIDCDERGVLIGPTGCGKTEVAKMMLEGFKGDLCIVDPKRLFLKPGDMQRLNLQSEVSTLRAATFWGRKRFVIKPDRTNFRNMDFYNEIYNWAYERGNVCIYTDDLVGVLPQGKQCVCLQDCYQLGREHNVAMLCSVQRPAFYPGYIFSDANHFYCFETIYPADVKRIKEYIPGYNPHALDNYKFLFFDKDTHQTQITRLKLPEK